MANRIKFTMEYTEMRSESGLDHSVYSVFSVVTLFV